MPQLLHFAIDMFRLCLWLVLLAAVFVPLERLFAVRPERLWRRQIAVDLGYYFLSSLLPAVIIALPMALFATALNHVLPAASASWALTLPLWLRFCLAMVVAECGAYWGHRWSHHSPLLWRFHAVHHSAEHMDWLVNTRAHPVDMVFIRLCALMPLYALGLAQPIAGAGAALPIIVAIVTTFWGFFVHANVRWRYGVLEQVFAGPAFHHWHHSRHDHINRNYSTMFPWMDRLFGTLHLPAAWPSGYGIETPMPQSLAGQLLEPLVAPRRLGHVPDRDGGPLPRPRPLSPPAN